MQARIQRWDGGQAIRIPEAMLNQLHLQEDDEVELALFEGMLMVKPTKLRRPVPRQTLEEMFEGYTGDYVPCELDTGAPVGREVC